MRTFAKNQATHAQLPSTQPNQLLPAPENHQRIHRRQCIDFRRQRKLVAACRALVAPEIDRRLELLQAEVHGVLLVVFLLDFFGFHRKVGRGGGFVFARLLAVAAQLDLQAKLIGRVGVADRFLIADVALVVELEQRLVEGAHAELARLVS